MASRGAIFKRCGCRDRSTGHRIGPSCARLGQRYHGSWYFHCSVTDLWGQRARIRRGGHRSKAAACRARDAVLEQSCSQTTAQTWTVARWLRFWLGTRRSIRPSTLRFYTQYVERYLIPHLGRIRLADLSTRDIAAMFAKVEQVPSRRGTPLAAGSLQRMRATLRAALNAAIREGLLIDNPARHVELANPHRPHPVVWTQRRVDAWRQTGARPAVAVWTARQLAEFLHHIDGDRLYALWWLIALRGLRRGEAAGLRWVDLDLDHRQLTVNQQLTTCGTAIVVSPPKSAASRRTIALDHSTVEVLRAHAHHQQAERIAAGTRWRETGYVFTRPNGIPVQPDYLSERFHRLVTRHDLPPVRLHDLRHGAASLAHSAGADLKTVQDQLGHASIVLTADTYTSVLPTAQYKAADATARLVLVAARAVSGKLRARSEHVVATPRPELQKQPTEPPATPGGPPSIANPAKRSPQPKSPPRRRRRAKAKTRHTHRTP